MRYLFLLFVFISTFSFAQKNGEKESEKAIEEVIIKSKPKLATILKKLNKQLLKANRYDKFCVSIESNKSKK